MCSILGSFIVHFLPLWVLTEIAPLLSPSCMLYKNVMAFYSYLVGKMAMKLLNVDRLCIMLVTGRSLIPTIHIYVIKFNGLFLPCCGKDVCEL